MNPGGFRLLLAVLVFVSHVTRYNFGRPAVALFFMLSGYWVSRLYERRPDESVLVYYQDRFLRIWPLLATVAVAVVAVGALRGVPHSGSLASTLLLLGLATRQGDVIGVAWSLDVELQFYLLLPVCATALAVIAPRWRAATALTVLVAATAVGTQLLRHSVVTVLAYAPAFFAGATIWFRRWQPRWTWSAVSVASFVAAIVALVALGVAPALLLKGRQLWWSDPALVALCLLLTPFVAWNVHRQSSRLDRHLGNLSFPFYVVQYPIIAATAASIGTGAVAKVVALLVTVAATFLLYWGVDRQFEKMRHYLSGRAFW